MVRLLEAPLRALVRLDRAQANHHPTRMDHLLVNHQERKEDSLHQIHTALQVVDRLLLVWDRMDNKVNLEPALQLTTMDLPLLMVNKDLPHRQAMVLLVNSVALYKTLREEI